MTHVLAEEEGRVLVAGVVHAHTSVSDGDRSPAELVELAHRKGLGVVCVTDHHDDEWRYRFGVRIRRRSVSTRGAAEYLAEVRDAARASEGPIVLAGIEVAPHYRWEGLPPFLRCEVMKTLVAYGVEDPEAIGGLPVRLDGRGRDEAEAVRTAQQVIDHLRGHGALVYWSHLEHDERNRFLTARLRNRPRPWLLRDTGGYTGFGCLPQGHRSICAPGGPWDDRLGFAAQRAAYDGPWTLGEADYHGGDRVSPAHDVANPVTVFALRSLDAGQVLEALARGRMYAYAGPRFRASLLRTFRVVDPRSGAVAGAGDVLRTAGAPQVELRVSGFPGGCRARIIAAGRVVGEGGPGELRCALAPPRAGAYACRAEVAGPDERIVSNPIFVAPQAA
jgi:hypothetical protein